uniref:Thioredoxin domain-containing protein n=1 Tax=Tetranychus urticae TaxID=32264 RepID=T1JXA2_TETUR
MNVIQVICRDLDLNLQTFKDLSTSTNLLVLFLVPWCGPCLNYQPKWKQLMKYFNDDPTKFDLLVGRIDCSKEVELCDVENVNFYPTVRLYSPTRKRPIEAIELKDFNVIEEFLRKNIKLRAEIDFASLMSTERLDSDESSEHVLTEPDEPEPDRVSGVYELNEDNLEKFLSKGRHFVKFYAPWCGHCRNLAPTWKLLGDTFQNDKSVSISMVDCEAYSLACQKFDINSYPTLLWIVDGEIVDRYNGMRSHKDLKAFVNRKKKEDQLKLERQGTVRSEDVIHTLTNSNINKVIRHGVTFVKFWVPWCSHCKALRPVWNELSRKLLGRVKVASLDCSQFEDICEKYQVNGYPTLIIFRNGRAVSEYEQERSLDSLVDYALSFADDSRDEL